MRQPIMTDFLFDLDDRHAHTAYVRWRDAKLAAMPTRADDLIVEVNDPRVLTLAEHVAISERLERANMVIYASPILDEDKSIPLALGRQFGLARLDGNWLADEDKITRITVNHTGTPSRAKVPYIPYTPQPMNWHTDGYYNDAAEPICAMLLHCVRAAPQGGENTLLDHEIAYLRLRDHNPYFVRALMAHDAMTIPAREDDDGVARAAVTGPVFSRHPVSARLHMRYTARTRSIAWAEDDITQAAVAWLRALLASSEPAKIRVRLEPGMGLLCANVLHDRTRFEDDPKAPRLLYRARYFDEIRCGTTHSRYPELSLHANPTAQARSEGQACPAR